MAPPVINIASKSVSRTTLKFLVVGDYGVGKTALVRRYTDNKFSSTYRMTIGVDYAQKTIIWDPNTVVNVQLWDVAGNEKFRCVTRVYYKHAAGAAVVFDLTRKDTLNLSKHWIEDIRNNVLTNEGSSIPIILLGNKCDVDASQIPVETITRFCQEHNIDAWCTTSALLDINVNKSFQYLIELALKANVLVEHDKDIIRLQEKPSKNESFSEKVKCC